MKKRIIVLILALCLAFSLVSCKQEVEPAPNDPNVYFSKDSRYQAYLEHYQKSIEYSLPGFVKYEAISIVGEFVSFENYIGSVFSEYIYIAYTCMDATGQTVDLHIRHTGAEAMPANEKVFPGMRQIGVAEVDPISNMKRLLAEDQGGFVDIGEVRYIYTHGKLYGVKWVHAGYEFMITDITNYSITQASTFTARLLDVAQYNGAVLDFKTAFDAVIGG